MTSAPKPNLEEARRIASEIGGALDEDDKYADEAAEGMRQALKKPALREQPDIRAIAESIHADLTSHKAVMKQLMESMERFVERMST